VKYGKVGLERGGPRAATRGGCWPTRSPSGGRLPHSHGDHSNPKPCLTIRPRYVSVLMKYSTKLRNSILPRLTIRRGDALERLIPHRISDTSDEWVHVLSTRLSYFCTRQAFIPSQRDRRIRFLATSSYVIISNSKRGGTTYSNTTSSFQGK